MDSGVREALEDQAATEPTANLLHDARLPGVGGAPSDRVVEQSCELDDVVLDVGPREAPPVKEVEDLHAEEDAPAQDHDVAVVQIPVVRPLAVDLLEAAGERVREVKGLERGQTTSRRLPDEIREKKALHELGDEAGDLPATKAVGL